MRGVAAGNYTYAETNYTNPHALTGYFNGSATTTYSYDAIGNLATTTGAATSTFMWDYRNRMIRAWVSGATSTYQYDHTIARMRQVLASSTTDYPNRFYSLATSTQSGTGTSTAYIWHGDVLVATIEQRLVNGVASGTATTYYVHPDHLGSTNAITNSAGVVKQALDYYPYGAQRINTGMDASDRRFIGQFTDDATSLDYLNARYYDPARGQFLSEDPSFLAVGDPNQLKQITGREQQAFLADPQKSASYGYARDNPIVMKDPEGKFGVLGVVAVGVVTNVALQGLEDYAAGNSPQWQNYAGAAVGGAAGAAALLSSGNPAVVGAISRGVEEYATQWFNGVSSGTGGNIDYSSVAANALAGGIFGKLGAPGLKGVTAGPNSMDAVTSQIATKLSRGMIQNFTVPTASKMLTAQFINGVPQAIMMGGASNPRVMNQLSSMRAQLEGAYKQLESLRKKQQ